MERINPYNIQIKLNNFISSDKDIEKTPYNDICKLLNINPVLVARHFQYRIENFL